MTTTLQFPAYRRVNRMADFLDSAFLEAPTSNYPPYNIELLAENEYLVTLAVAGFSREELSIDVENSLMSIRGEKQKASDESGNIQNQYLHQGIAFRSFERRFNLADHVEVEEANLNNGLLSVRLVKRIPEAMKRKQVPINLS